MNNGPIRLARRAAWVLVVAAILLVAAWTVWNVVASSRFESALQSLEERGYATTFAGLAPAKIPASENAAPFYSAAFALFVKAPEEAFADALDHPDKVRELEPEDRAKLKTWLDGNRDAFEMVAKARTRSRCRYEHDFSQGYSMLLPEISEIMGMSRALQARAVLQAPAGDVAGAQEAVRSILALGESLRDEPVLVEQLVRFMTLRLAMATIDACVTEKTSEEDLGAWRALLPRGDVLQGALERGLRGEMAMAAGAISGSPKEFWMLFSSRQGEWTALLRPVLRADGVRYLEIMKLGIDASGKRYADSRADYQRIESLVTDVGRSWCRPVCGALLPGLSRSSESATAATAHVAVVRAGLDAELARRRSGKYPDALETTDPFTSRPLTLDLAGGKIVAAQPTSEPEPIEWSLRAAKK
jgi:hypothetical protein